MNKKTKKSIVYSIAAIVVAIVIGFGYFHFMVMAIDKTEESLSKFISVVEYDNVKDLKATNHIVKFTDKDGQNHMIITVRKVKINNANGRKVTLVYQKRWYHFFSNKHEPSDLMLVKIE